MNVFDERRVKELKELYPDMPVSLIASLCRREPTQAQSIFRKTILNHLTHNKFRGSIEHETFFCIDRTHGKIKEFDFKSPDIYLPEYKIAIDVDGSSHTQSISKMNNDSLRESFYKSLEIDHLEIPNEKAMNCADANDYCSRVLIPLILQKKTEFQIGKSFHAKAQKEIHSHRLRFLNAYPELSSYFPVSEEYVYRPDMYWRKYMLGLIHYIPVEGLNVEKGSLVTDQQILHTYLGLIPYTDKHEIAKSLGVSTRTLERRLASIVSS